ncbi:MAG: glycosyltransferase family 25 protein [Acidiferrobacterales bacterium]|nr:glycosyltransferase family 25 protein [Acidiferrobacterales bacterium]
MKCVVINLERAHDRRERIAHQFNTLGIEFEFFIGIDGHQLPDEEYFHFGDQHSGLINWKHPNVPGMLGAWTSHTQVWRNALSVGLDMVAVFEDDVTLAPKVGQVLTAVEVAVENGLMFDIVFMDNRRPYRSFVSIADIDHEFSIGLIRHGNIGASGYIITRTAMQQLLKKFPRMPVAVDQLMHAGWKSGLQTFTLSPQIVFHGLRFVDHGSYVCSPIRMKRTWRQKFLYFFEFSVPKRVSFYRRANGFKHT